MAEEAERKLSPAQVQRLELIFRKMDTDGSGQLELEEMRDISDGDEELMETLQIMDWDESGTVSLSEWLEHFETMVNECPDYDANMLITDFEDLIPQKIRDRVVDAQQLATVGPDAGDPSSTVSSSLQECEAILKNLRINLDPSCLKTLDQVGEGYFAEVYRADYSGTTVAMKRFRTPVGQSEPDHDFIEVFKLELGHLCQLRHPNIVMLIGACISPTSLITEYCENGNLFEMLKDKNRTLSWPQRVQMALDEARGISHMHVQTPPIIHRDLKSLNLLLDKNLGLRVCDFGLARARPPQGTLMTKECGTYQWMAPEVLSGGWYSEQADVFSFGVNLWEICTCKIPHEGKNPKKAALAALRGDVRLTLDAAVAKEVPPEYRDLMERCWAVKPTQRPTMHQAVEILEALVMKLGPHKVVDLTELHEQAERHEVQQKELHETHSAAITQQAQAHDDVVKEALAQQAAQFEARIAKMQRTHRAALDAARAAAAAAATDTAGKVAGRSLSVKLNLGMSKIPSDMVSALELLTSSLDESERKVDEILALL